MTPQQFDIIKRQARWTEWRFPFNRDVKCCQLLFDLSSLLPDDKGNVEAFLRDCPAPGYWSYFIDEDTEEKRWVWVDPFEQRQWYVSCEIESAKVASMSKRELQDYENLRRDHCFLTLVAMLTEATDYVSRKTDEERTEMYKEFERQKLAGPPNNV